MNCPAGRGSGRGVCAIFLFCTKRNVQRLSGKFFPLVNFRKRGTFDAVLRLRVGFFTHGTRHLATSTTTASATCLFSATVCVLLSTTRAAVVHVIDVCVAFVFLAHLSPFHRAGDMSPRTHEQKTNKRTKVVFPAAATTVCPWYLLVLLFCGKAVVCFFVVPGFVEVRRALQVKNPSAA